MTDPQKMPSPTHDEQRLPRQTERLDKFKREGFPGPEEGWGALMEALELSRRQDATEAAVVELRRRVERIESFTNFCAKSWLDRVPMKESREFAEKYLEGAQTCPPAPTSSPTEPAAGEGWGPDVVKVWEGGERSRYKLLQNGTVWHGIDEGKGRWDWGHKEANTTLAQLESGTSGVGRVRLVSTRPAPTPAPQQVIGVDIGKPGGDLFARVEGEIVAGKLKINSVTTAPPPAVPAQPAPQAVEHDVAKFYEDEPSKPASVEEAPKCECCGAQVGPEYAINIHRGCVAHYVKRAEFAEAHAAKETERAKELEAELKTYQELSDYRLRGEAGQRERADKAEKERDSLRAQLAAADKVVEAADKVRAHGHTGIMRGCSACKNASDYDAAKLALATLKGKA